MSSAVGIDPGKNGAIVHLAITPDGIVPVEAWLLRGYLIGTGKAAVWDVARLARDLGHLPASATVAIERVGVRPGEGVSGAFAFGFSAGMLRGLFAAYDVLMPTPRKWQGAILADIPGEDTKAKAVVRASSIAGLQLVQPRCRVPHEGIADAACIALYALRVGK